MYSRKTDREIAVELDTTEEEVKKMRRDSGFLRLSEFQSKEDINSSLSMDVELDEMEKRKLQGYMGEKVTALMKNRVVDHLEGHVKDNWVIRDKLHIVNEASSFQRYWASGRPRQGEIRIEGRHLKHSNSTENELREYIQEKCVVAREEIFEKFREVRNPFIDFNFYAVKTVDKKEVAFTARDFTENRFESGQKVKAEIPVIEDFKIVMLEVKTTKEDAKKLFSKNQRKVRDMAKGSPFLEFFSLKVDKEFTELGLPSEMTLNIEKHS